MIYKAYVLFIPVLLRTVNGIMRNDSTKLSSIKAETSALDTRSVKDLKPSESYINNPELEYYRGPTSSSLGERTYVTPLPERYGGYNDPQYIDHNRYATSDGSGYNFVTSYGGSRGYESDRVTPTSGPFDSTKYYGGTSRIRYPSGKGYYGTTGTSIVDNRINYAVRDGVYDMRRVPYGPPQTVDIGGYNPEFIGYELYDPNGINRGQQEYAYGYNGPDTYGYNNIHHDLESKIKGLSKSHLLPIAGVALLGIAAALATNPVLFHLGTMSGKRRRRSIKKKLSKYSQILAYKQKLN